MSIENKIHQRNKKLKELYPSAEDEHRKKTPAELQLSTFLLHWHFLRFAFATLSFALYLPTIIELFQNSYTILDYVRNAIIVAILILLEIGLSFSLLNYYKRKHSENTLNLAGMKRVAFSIAIVSILLSGLSGVNAIDITDGGKEEAINKTRSEKKEDIRLYRDQIKSNDKIINQNIANIRENNVLINNNKSFAATKKGAAQIASYQARNRELLKQNKTLIATNNKIRDEIKEIRNRGDKLMQQRISHAGKKELIYMIIFFIAGIISVLGLMFSYNFIGQYYKHLAQGVEDIEALEDFYEEKLEKEIAAKERKERIKKEAALKTKELDKKIIEAEQEKAQLNSGTWIDDSEKKKPE
jgi:hypothetical protein